MITVLLIALFGFGVDTKTNSHEWHITEEYSIEFSGSGASGTFTNLSGKIIFDPEDPKSALFNVQLDPSTISTGNKTKDKHAKGNNWFDVKAFPSIGFRSKSVSKTENGFLTNGVMEIHGIEKEVNIPFTFDLIEEKKARFSGTFSLDRTDFEIMGPFFGFVVGDVFEVKVEVVMKR